MYAALITFWTISPWPAAAGLSVVLPLDGTPPDSTALITIDWNGAGTPSSLSRAVRSVLSWVYVTAPSTATPVTAPISRLVLAADAAVPAERSGMADSTDEVTGTTVMPMPMPASANAIASGA